MENMALTYAADDDSIYLITVPVEELCTLSVAFFEANSIGNMHQQTAAKIAANFDRRSERTIGMKWTFAMKVDLHTVVLTKADRLELHEMSTWPPWINEFLLQRHSLIHGYFITRTSVRTLENWEWDVRVQEERQYFASTAWSETGLNNYCGTERFGAALATALDQLLRRRYIFIS